MLPTAAITNRRFFISKTMTQTILTPSQVEQPRIVSRDELRQVLLRYTFGYKWAEDAIDDLWKLGAPMPQAEGQPERRILLPGQFAKWWAELAQRMSYPTTGQEQYGEIKNLFRASGGTQ